MPTPRAQANYGTIGADLKANVTTLPKLLSLSYHSFGTSVTTTMVRM